MERVSPTIRLVVRSCIFCTTLTTFLALLGAIRHKNPILGKRRQILALLIKLVLDLIPVILADLKSSKRTSLDDGTIRLVDSILLCFSFICITSLEHLFLWIAHHHTSDTGLGWVIYRPGITVTIVINLSLFVPFIKWRNESYHFWTISGASCLHFSLFCFAHIWLAKHLQLPRKWSRLAGGYLACLIVALLSLTSLFVGWKVLMARDLLPKILLLCTSAQLSIRICFIIATQARKYLSSSSEASRQTGQNGRPPTSVSTKPLVWDSSSGNFYIAPPVPNESCSSINSQPSPSRVFTPLPPGRLPSINNFVQYLIANGEDLTSIRIQLETQWPQSVGCDFSYLEYFLRRHPERLIQPVKQTVGNEGNTEALRDSHAVSDLQFPPRRKALIIVNLQNNSFVNDDLYITKNHDFVPRLKELIPYFRNDTDIFWVCTHMDQEATFYQEGTRGAEIYRDILDTVDETKDSIVIKHHHSAFDQTSLLMALRKMLILDIYLCGFLTNADIYSTAADAVQHGLRVTVIEDCLGYRSEKKHKQAIGQMVEILGVNKIASEGIMNEYGGLPVPDMESLGIPLSELRLNTDENTTGGGIMVAAPKVESTAS